MTALAHTGATHASLAQTRLVDARLAETGLPSIAITAGDSERLTRLSSAVAGNFPAVAEFLVREISRARILADGEAASGLVRMGSEVEFLDAATGQTRTMTLVYPEGADIAAGKLSILTPIGAALIGLSVNQSIEFQPPTGQRRSLKVLAVRNP